MREHTGRSLGIAGVAIAFLATLPFVLTVTLWTSLFVYALVKMIGGGSDAASARTVLLIVVILVATLTLALAGAIALIGRPMMPSRRAAD